MNLEDILTPLNPEQREAVEHDGKYLLILAGAGSGKTRVITTKIAWLIATGRAHPSEILAVTFTNKAAAEMLGRVMSMVGDARGVTIRTFHSFGARLLRRYAERAGLDPNFRIYDDDDSISLLKSLYDSTPKKELSRYSRLISRAKDYYLFPDDDLESISFDPELPETYVAYQKRLLETGNADFGDLIVRTVRLLRDNRDVREEVRERYRYILVDEYQDSNVAQFELLKTMTGPDTHLCVVGDDDQSIYRFRGAEVRNILEFPDLFEDTSVVRLEQNYRSTNAILDLASHIVGNNRGRLGKTLWTDRTGGARPVLARLFDQNEEAEYCARILGDERYEETAVLYRTNAQSLAFETLFNRRGIPYRIVGSLGFYEREEVKDSIAFLSLFVNHRDEVAFRRIVNKPTRGIGGKSVSRIVEASVHTRGDLIEAMIAVRDDLSSRSRKGVDEFLEIHRELSASLEQKSLSQFVNAMLHRSGLLRLHGEEDEVSGSTRIGNMEELVNAAAFFENGRSGLAGFLEEIELDRSRFERANERSEAEGDKRVTLITMHNTKGLEFPRVIITGLDDGLFPGWRSESVDDLEEERRIFYVSVTRAMDELYLTTCCTRRLWGRTSYFEPSRFLSEIPEDLLEIDSDVDGGSGIGGPGRSAAYGTTGAAVAADVPDEYAPGASVYHDEYGYGSIIKSWYNASELVVLVRFETGRTARFLPKYANLERMEVDD